MSWDLVHGRVALLDVDPDLAIGLDEEQQALATRQAVAAALEVEPPDWDPSFLRQRAAPGWLGLLVVDGLLIRCVTVGKRTACELFGPGDMFRPWDADGEYSPLMIGIRWRILASTKLAVLDTAFASRIARWPTINAHLMGRLAKRARYLALTQAATHLPRTHARLLILFWLLAERWGRVVPQGVRITLPLTHEILAMLVGAQRPSVTVALKRLSTDGLLLRPRTGEWLLTKPGIRRLELPESFAPEPGVDGHGPAVEPLPLLGPGSTNSSSRLRGPAAARAGARGRGHDES